MGDKKPAIPAEQIQQPVRQNSGWSSRGIHKSITFSNSGLDLGERQPAHLRTCTWASVITICISDSDSSLEAESNSACVLGWITSRLLDAVAANWLRWGDAKPWPPDNSWFAPCFNLVYFDFSRQDCQQLRLKSHGLRLHVHDVWLEVWPCRRFGVEHFYNPKISKLQWRRRRGESERASERYEREGGNCGSLRISASLLDPALRSPWEEICIMKWCSPAFKRVNQGKWEWNIIGRCHITLVQLLWGQPVPWIEWSGGSSEVVLLKVCGRKTGFANTLLLRLDGFSYICLLDFPPFLSRAFRYFLRDEGLPALSLLGCGSPLPSFEWGKCLPASCSNPVLCAVLQPSWRCTCNVQEG